MNDTGTPGAPGLHVACAHGLQGRGHFDLSHLANELAPYGGYKWDRTLDAARLAYSAARSQYEMAEVIRDWLNKWLCRIGNDDASTALFAGSWTAWCDLVALHLGSIPDLARLTEGHVDLLAELYDHLRDRPGAVDASGRVRAVGATAASKALLFLFEDSVPAWDQAIRDRLVDGGEDFDAYASHLRGARCAALCLEDQLARSGSPNRSVAEFIGREPAPTAYIIDTANYLNL